MLETFEVKGFRGFQTRLRLDLSARNYDFNPAVVRDGLVKNALIYGKNGTGKSSLGIALFDLIRHLMDTKPFDEKYLDPYKNLNLPEAEPVSFAYTFRFGADRVEYRYEKLSINELLRETLIFNDRTVVDYDYFDAKQQWIDRDIFGALNVDLPDNKLSVVKYLYRNLPTNRVPLLTQLMTFCEGMLWYRCLSDGNDYAGFSPSANTLQETLYDSGKIKEFEAFLRENDLHYDLEFRDIDGRNELFARFADGRVARFATVASTGTMTLFLFYAWSISFPEISFLFIDEFDAFLHYEASADLVRHLNSIPNLQTILTTHNVQLMQNALTRPDACFILTPEKISSLANATQKELREAHNLEKLYVNGAFRE